MVDCLGDVGGSLGLFLGASLLTVAEFTDWCGKEIIKACQGKKEVPPPPPYRKTKAKEFFQDLQPPSPIEEEKKEDGDESMVSVENFLKIF